MLTSILLFTVFLLSSISFTCFVFLIVTYDVTSKYKTTLVFFCFFAEFFSAENKYMTVIVVTYFVGLNVPVIFRHLYEPSQESITICLPLNIASHKL